LETYLVFGSFGAGKAGTCLGAFFWAGGVFWVLSFHVMEAGKAGVNHLLGGCKQTPVNNARNSAEILLGHSSSLLSVQGCVFERG
jgi:hypothetical protein